MDNSIWHRLAYRFNTPTDHCPIEARTLRPQNKAATDGGLYLSTAGFTLIELLVTLGIATVILTLAIPGFDSLLYESRLATHANSYITTLHLARSEATRRNTRVAVCKSADGATCTTSGYWSQGWLVFQDSNNNAQVDAGEEILRVHEAISSTLVLKGNNPVANYVSYSSMGYTRQTSGALQAGTLTLCNASSPGSNARELVISATGRPRIRSVTLAECP